jgi:MYXO-CTERM domain-containing protein
MAAPFASWARAQAAASPGDTVYFRGGTYKYTAATSTCTSTTATVNDVVLSKSGTPGNTINYWAYPGETPIFDFSGVTDTSMYSCRQVGVRVEADWLYLKGLELKGVLQLNSDNHESWCVYVYGGSNNLFELLNAHHNMGPGFFIQQGGNNTFLNCDSHENEDTLTSNGDGQSADGFGCHPNQTGDTGNLLHGCRSWWNSDDAYDFIDSQAACTVEYSWAWYAGYKPDALSGGLPVALAAGNGNGFKGGGYGDPQTNVPAPPIPQHIIRLTASFYNKEAGYYANHEIVSPYFYNNTGFNNHEDFDMLGLDGTTTTSVGILRNNLAYFNASGPYGTAHAQLTANMDNGGPISDEYNSWDTTLNLTVTDADFQSVAFAPPTSCPEAYTPGGTVCVPPTDTTSFAGMASARQADGSLPVLPFLRLAPKSDLIDKGINVGLPFSGSAPDLGCFDTALPYDATDGGPSSDGASDSSLSSDAGTDGSSALADSSATDGRAAGGGSGGSSAGGSGGSTSSGGAGGTGGSSAAGGGSGGSGGNGDAGDEGETPSGSSNGCSCRAGRESGEQSIPSFLALVGVLAARRRREERRAGGEKEPR